MKKNPNPNHESFNYCENSDGKLANVHQELPVLDSIHHGVGNNKESYILSIGTLRKCRQVGNNNVE